MHELSVGARCTAVLGASITVITAIGLLAFPRTWATANPWRPTWTWIGAPARAEPVSGVDRRVSPAVRRPVLVGAHARLPTP
jgi:hypothetical protein